MSGRSRYRKGHHPILGRFGKPAPQRRSLNEMPPWRLVITLPTAIGFAVRPGPTGVIGVTVRDDRKIEVEGADWEWVYKQAAAYLAVIGKDFDGPLPFAELTRGAEPPLTDSSPPADKPIKREQRIILVSRPSVIFLRDRRAPVIFAA